MFGLAMNQSFNIRSKHLLESETEREREEKFDYELIYISSAQCALEIYVYDIYIFYIEW